MIKVSDYIFEYFLSQGIDTIFCVSGGAAAHMLNSVHEKGIKIIHCHHEQACAMAAEGYARISGKPAIVLVTNGPGSTNTITGVLGAFQDSIPMIVLSGQVPTTQTMSGKGPLLRQMGVQECNIIRIVESITKFAKQIRTINDISYNLSRAYVTATTGRQGPVWLDIPLDIQASMVDESELNSFYENRESYIDEKYDVDFVIAEITKAQRPLIIAGNGIHLSKSEAGFYQLLNKMNIPVVTTWNAKDLLDHNDSQFIGSFGLFGDRASNYAVQNADLLLILGSRLSIPNIGYDTKAFSPNSIKIMVDIDPNEIYKSTLHINGPIIEDLKVFFDKMLSKLTQRAIGVDGWNNELSQLKYNNDVVLDEDHKTEPYKINSYHFIEELGKQLKDNHIVVTDMGTAFTCTMQALKMNGKARLFTSSGTASMGYGLPAAIGAWIADPTKEIILIAGDGGFQMNIQELQTLAQYRIPIKMFILDNNGYLAISLMQDNLFNGNHIGSTFKDVSAPEFIDIAQAYGIGAMVMLDDEPGEMSKLLKLVLDEKRRPYLCQVNIPEHQLLIPRVQSQKDANGKIISNKLDNMFPYGR